jgi:aromatic-L-amino-acid decarboxylase
MGKLLRSRLIEKDWKLVNQTPLPLICFTDGASEWSLSTCQKIADTVVASGKAWISTVQLGKQKRPALRACITNYLTESDHIDALIAILNQVRDSEGTVGVSGNCSAS